MLAECVASITAQTVRPAAHLIYIDHDRKGCSHATNTVAKMVRTPWIATLADDDLAYPNHLETLLAHSLHADVVYSKCVINDMRSGEHGGYTLGDPPNIPSTALIRTSVWRKVGGYHGVVEDNETWQTMLSQGARFQRVDVVTWEYRFHQTEDHVNDSRP
jgi:glycosyltransferase involved in cell wall biosynthesis